MEGGGERECTTTNMKATKPSGETTTMTKANKIDLKKLDEQLDRVWSLKSCSSNSSSSNQNKGGIIKNIDHSGKNKGILHIDSDDNNIGAHQHSQSKLMRDNQVVDLSKLTIRKDVIGQGSFGSVHRGVYDGTDVAVKVVAFEQSTKSEIDSLIKAFNQEVLLWSKLDHPNIIKFIAATETNDIASPKNVYCTVAEYLSGGTLKRYLMRNSNTKIPLRTAIELALDMAKGLNYLHSENIVHRDVKSENMILDNNGRLKIADFGVARLESLERNEMTGQTGTLGYMAPEVLEGKGYDKKCDVYSFGISLWEIYCCDMPYPPSKFANINSAIANKDLRPKIPRCCPKSLAKLMKRCWSSDPSKRPEMKDVVAILEGINTSKGGGMIPPNQPQCFCLFPRRGP